MKATGEHFTATLQQQQQQQQHLQQQQQQQCTTHGTMTQTRVSGQVAKITSNSFSLLWPAQNKKKQHEISFSACQLASRPAFPHSTCLSSRSSRKSHGKLMLNTKQNTLVMRPN